MLWISSINRETVNIDFPFSVSPPETGIAVSPCFPVRAFRHGDFEDGSLAEDPRFVDGDTGNSKDLADQEETEAGILSIPFFKNLLLLSRRDPDTIVGKRNEEAGVFLFARDGDGCHPLPVLYSIVEEIKENLVNHRVGKDLDCLAGIAQSYPLGPATADNLVDEEP